ncbi:MAG: septum formation protein Maf [candidate division Zixibacteria bacterium RBG_16_43_9]|nr:MAG: septum formation protein Maf [candidate division Zixibacteria bacterium RBG_16_43_9]
MSSDLTKLLNGKKFVLGSSSPRRAELLRKAGINFVVVVPENINEEQVSSDPVSHVLELSRKKAENVAKKVRDSIILGADTIVVLNGEILGKPKDSEEAFKMLKKLSGKEHKVYTGISLVDKKEGKTLSGYQLTKVKFNQLKDKEIKDYIDTGEPLDKAGAYGIQGMGNFLVEKIEGDLDNVIGLPLRKLEELLIKIRN